MNSRTAFRRLFSPNKIIRSKQDSVMLRTKRSAQLFRFGDRGGSFTDSTQQKGLDDVRFQIRCGSSKHGLPNGIRRFQREGLSQEQALPFGVRIAIP